MNLGKVKAHASRLFGDGSKESIKEVQDYIKSLPEELQEEVSNHMRLVFTLNKRKNNGSS